MSHREDAIRIVEDAIKKTRRRWSDAHPAVDDHLGLTDVVGINVNAAHMILAELEKSDDSPRDARRQFLEIATQMKRYYNDDGLSWKDKYKLIFELKQDLFETGIKFDYYTIDGSYQDDISDFYWELEKKVEDLGGFLEYGD